MPTTTKTTYGLRSRFTDALARLIREDVDFNGKPVAPRYRLTSGLDDEADFVYEVDTAEKAALVLAFNTPDEISSRSYPNWGVVDISEYRVAEITRETTVTIRSHQAPALVRFDRVVGQRETSRASAESRLKHAVPLPLGQRMSFGVAPVPAGESLESLKEKCNGRVILVGSESPVPELCIGVTELPEEYVRLFTVEQGVGLVLTRVPS